MLTKELELRIENALQQLCYPSLLKGDMGVCIYYFLLGKMRGDSHLTLLGENALETIMADMTRYKKLNIEDGITGIALGITYLLRNQLVQGNVNEALRDIDAYVYKGISIIQENSANIDTNLPLLDVLIYFLVRYDDVENPTRKTFYGRIIEHLFNYIYIHRPDSFYQESFPFNLNKTSYLFILTLVRIYQLDIERERITEIFKEMKEFLFSNIPLLQANRLYLMTVSRAVAKYLGDKEWMDFSNLLSQDMSLRYILEDELTDKNLFPMTGVVGIWLLLEANKLMGCPVNSEVREIDLTKRINNSSLWDRIEVDGEYLSSCYSLNGYCGIILFLEYLKTGVWI